MPYRTTTRGKRTYTRRTRGAKSGGRRPRRKYPTRKRRSPKMSRKRILNITSRKKKDNMLVYTNTTAGTPAGNSVYGTGAPELIGGITYLFPWVATARTLVDSTGGLNVVGEQSQRTASSCYMRGLKERVQIQTNNGRPWQWRRICFTLKGNSLTGLAATGLALNSLTSNGVQRTVNSMHGYSAYNNVLDLVFDGVRNVDWSSVFNAKTDTDRLAIRFDKTRIITAGNDSGMMRNYSLWHAMNKNLDYDDDESGQSEVTNAFSTPGRKGMGDYYIMDFIASGTGGSSADLMTWNPEATLYWHEK